MSVYNSHPYECSHWLFDDLDVPHYWSKWKSAVEYADMTQRFGEFEWYMAARRRFLELGGCYVHERPRQ